MLSEFQDLSDKIERLAALTAQLRKENAALRAENSACRHKLTEAQRRVEALLDQLPQEEA